MGDGAGYDIALRFFQFVAERKREEMILKSFEGRVFEGCQNPGYVLCGCPDCIHRRFLERHKEVNRG